MKLNFLEAKMPLTKSFTLGADGKIEKSSYPNAYLFTSHAETCDTLVDFYKTMVSHAKLGHCLLKGMLDKKLVNESRASSTTTDAQTEWICLDWDKAKFSSPREALDSIVIGTGQPFKDIAHVVQYSASQGIGGSTTLNCHIFIKLSKPVHAPYLKAWLIYLNLRCKALSDMLTLNELGTHISWPLDITTCQNDKLIYIAAPVLNGVSSSLKETDRYQLVKGKGDLDTLPVERITSISMEKVRSLAHDKKNELRVEGGYDRQRMTKPKMDGSEYIVHSASEAVITGMREDEEFVHFNLNGGDSWSYWHPVNNYEYIHCFKHPDDKLITSEILPGYYRQKEAERVALNASPTETGDLILTFSAKNNGTYHRGIWNAKDWDLDVNAVKSVKHLDHWRQQHGRDPDEFIPTWTKHFNPHSDIVVDIEHKVLNEYVPAKFMRKAYKVLGIKASFKKCPMTIRTMAHVLGCAENDELLEHLLNWLAVIYQKRVKTRTAWLVSGIEGTGKGVLANNILAPTLGEKYVARYMCDELHSQFNGWMEKALIVILNEASIPSSKEKTKLQDKMKHFITEPTMPIRNMHQAVYEARSFANFILPGNTFEIQHITDGDRRYNVGNYQDKKLLYVQADIDAICAENEAWVEYVMTREADAERAGTTIKNEARSKLIEVSRTSVDNVARALLKGDFMVLFGEMPDMDYQAAHCGYTSSAIPAHYDDIIRREAGLLVAQGQTKGAFVTFKSKLTRDELQTIFEYCVGNMPVSPIKFSQFLKHRGINVDSISVEGKSARGIHVQWQITKGQRDELSACLQETPPKAASKISSVVPKAKLKIVK